MNNLAALYVYMGKYAMAEPLMVEALLIRKKVLEICERRGLWQRLRLRRKISLLLERKSFEAEASISELRF